MSVSDVSRVLDMSYFIEQKVLWHTIHFYPYKIKPVLLLQNGNSEVRKNFVPQFFAWIVVAVNGPWNIVE